MKCPRCLRNHKYRDGMRCTCGHRFCFDPKKDRLTDGKFLAAVRSASRDETYFYTANQLYMAYCRRQYRPAKTPLIFAAALLAATAVFTFMLPPLAIFTLIAAAIATLVALVRKFQSPPTMAQFRSFIKRWQAGDNQLEHLIDAPRLATPPPEWTEPDIYDYGVEGILVVERDLLVDLFVLNGFHTEQRLLVLSASGYPSYLLPVARQLLEARRDLPVFFLHDATPAGLETERLVRKSGLLPLEGHPTVDLGLAPEDAKQLQRLNPANPRQLDYAVPVDLLMYGILAAGLTQAIAQQTALATLLGQPAGAGSESYTGFG